MCFCILKWGSVSPRAEWTDWPVITGNTHLSCIVCCPVLSLLCRKKKQKRSDSLWIVHGDYNTNAVDCTYIPLGWRCTKSAVSSVLSWLGLYFHEPLFLGVSFIVNWMMHSHQRRGGCQTPSLLRWDGCPRQEPGSILVCALVGILHAQWSTLRVQIASCLLVLLGPGASQPWIGKQVALSLLHLALSECSLAPAH